MIPGRFLAQLFYSFDIYHAIINKEEHYPVVAKPIAACFAFLIQSGIVAMPIITIICSDNIAIGYRIMIGAGIGTMFSAIKEYFAEAERKRNLYYEVEEAKRECRERYVTLEKKYDALLKKQDKKHEASDKKHEASDKKHEASDKKHEASDKKHEASDKKHEASDKKHEASDKKHEASDKKHTLHEERLSNHENRLSDHAKKHTLHEEHLSNHDIEFASVKAEIEWNKPFVWNPFDPPSPRV